MARTRLFSALQRWCAEWRRAREEASQAVSKKLAGKPLTQVRVAARGAVGSLTRRELGSGLAALGLGCVSPPQPSAFPDAKTPQAGPSEPRIAVVGAGIAGLHAAYRLQQAGVSVEVFEASERVGGRLFTGRGLFPEGQVCELGGELIDSNHRWVQQLCRELGLSLDDRLAALPASYARDTWFVAGRVVPEATVAAQFSEVLAALSKDVAAAERDASIYDALNHTTLQAYLAAQVPPARFAELHGVLSAAYVGEFGLETSEQSALNLLYLIGTQSGTGFQIFGESDERYHIHGGNDQLPLRLAERLTTKVHLRHRLVRVAGELGKVELSFQTAAGALAVTEFTRVVFATPFSTLRLVDLSGLPLSNFKRRIIQELGYGTNAKVMAGFRSAFWQTEHHASGAVTSDTAMQQTWDSSIGQSATSAVLTNFLGGKVGLESGTADVESWWRGRLPLLEQIFPGAQAAYIAGTSVRMHWPSAPHSLGSYACYRPGQWEFWGKEGLAEGAAHFCGEHTSAEFQGWIEGAVESGVRVALEILKAHRLTIPASAQILSNPA